jgi:hypothetical protein
MNDKKDRIIIRIDKKLHKFLKKYCEKNYKTMTDVIVQHIHSLYKMEKMNDNLQNNEFNK